jgi:hypothetical protein
MQWPGWAMGYDAHLVPRVAVDDVRRAASEVRASMLEIARKNEDILTELVGHLLQAPEWPLSVIGLAEPTHLPLVLGVLAAVPNLKPDWTFSTWETRHDSQVTGLPEIVFLPEPQPQPPATIERTVVDTGEMRDVPSNFDIASGYVQHALFNTAPPAGHPLVAPAVRGVNDTTQALGIAGRMAGHGPAPQQGSAPPPSNPRSAGSASQPNGAGGRRRADHANFLVDALLRVSGPYQLLDALQALHSEGRNDPALRAELRARLSERRCWGTLVDSFDRHLNELVVQLIAATFGERGTDLEDPRAQLLAADVVADPASARLGQVLAVIGTPIADDVNPIRQAAARRYVDLVDPLATTQRVARAPGPPLPDGKAGRVASWSGAIRAAVSGSRAAIVTVAGLIMAILLGWAIAMVSFSAGLDQRLAAIERSMDGRGATQTPSSTAASQSAGTPEPPAVRFPIGGTYQFEPSWVAFLLVQSADSGWTGYPCETTPLTGRDHKITCNDPGRGPYQAVKIVAASPNQATKITTTPQGHVRPDDYQPLT